MNIFTDLTAQLWCWHVFRQLTGDALLLYGIDVRNVCKLGEMSDRLQVITAQKYKGAAAERVKSCILQHNKKMEETMDPHVHTGYIRHFITFCFGPVWVGLRGY